MPFEQHHYIQRPSAVETYYYPIVAGNTRNMHRLAADIRELIPWTIIAEIPPNLYIGVKYSGMTCQL